MAVRMAVAGGVFGGVLFCNNLFPAGYLRWDLELD